MSCEDHEPLNHEKKTPRNTYIGSLTSLPITLSKLRFSLYKSFFSVAFAHAAFHAASTTSAQSAGGVPGGLNVLQFARIRFTSFANSSMVLYCPSASLWDIVAKSIGFLISS